jgi:isoleucyl-tRNA synthetase
LIKDVLYCESQNDPKRRTVQTVLYIILKTYLILLAPIIPHTCEEAYKFLQDDHGHESIMLEAWIKNNV